MEGRTKIFLPAADAGKMNMQLKMNIPGERNLFRFFSSVKKRENLNKM